jgi:hypothetical protein
MLGFTKTARTQRLTQQAPCEQDWQLACSVVVNARELGDWLLIRGLVADACAAARAEGVVQGIAKVAEAFVNLPAVSAAIRALSEPPAAEEKAVIKASAPKL